jgi:hypothetical protein
MSKKLFLTIALVILLVACGTSNNSETVSTEQFQQMQETLQAQATQLALLMSTPTNTPTPRATPTANAPTDTPTAPAAEQPASQQSATTTQATYVIFPATVWRKGTAMHDPRYDVLFDPFQGGSSDHPPYGWYWQPNLPPPPEREAHEVAIILRAPARYRFIGPECQVFWNWDGNHPFQNGRLIVDRQNGEVYITPTTGNEAWIFVRCSASWAGGFSFEALQQLP